MVDASECWMQAKSKDSSFIARTSRTPGSKQKKDTFSIIPVNQSHNIVDTSLSKHLNDNTKSRITTMKFSAVFITMIAGAQAFQPMPFHRSTSVTLRAENDENIVDKAGHAIQDAIDNVGEAVDEASNPAPGTPTGLTKEEEKDMWDRQRSLQENRREHSSKEGRQEKYSDQPVVENDKHEELEEPWTKSDDVDDHYSINGKL